jgi:hypothetical protein
MVEESFVLAMSTEQSHILKQLLYLADYKGATSYCCDLAKAKEENLRLLLEVAPSNNIPNYFYYLGGLLISSIVIFFIFNQLGIDSTDSLLVCEDFKGGAVRIAIEKARAASSSLALVEEVNPNKDSTEVIDLKSILDNSLISAK